ncbi:hypothetical protein IQ07DRAFT_592985 [Pyrenochaeta sp. DS3sAY3a]|nr:hypothetical protein IQ07DRAFT_592985 [Pyrenochaeta sp. DS3sAY3a]
MLGLAAKSLQTVQLNDRYPSPQRRSADTKVPSMYPTCTHLSSTTSHFSDSQPRQRTRAAKTPTELLPLYIPT